MDRGVWVLRVRRGPPQPPGGLVAPVGSSVENAPVELELRGGDPQPPPACGVPDGAAPVRAGESEPVAEADEAAPVRRLKPPRAPTAVEREEHECSGHVPYRNWRRACVVGAGRMDPHCVAGDDQTKDIPVIGIDYGFLNDRDPAGGPGRVGTDTGVEGHAGFVDQRCHGSQEGNR